MIRSTASMLALTFGLAFTGCGPAESAEDEGSVLAEAAEAMAPEAPAPEMTPPAATTPQPTTPPPSAPAPAPRPAAPAPARPEPTAPAPAPMPPEREVFVPVGAELTFSVVEEISTKSAMAGDLFTATLVGDVLGEGGEVMLHAGSVLHGRVTESLQSPRNEDPAVIQLAIESIETSSGTQSLVAVVEEVQMQTDAKDTNKLTAGKVAVGAAAGALIGRITGRTKTGAAVGAAAGAAVAVATRDGHATIPAGAQMVVRLTERLIIQ